MSDIDSVNATAVLLGVSATERPYFETDGRCQNSVSVSCQLPKSTSIRFPQHRSPFRLDLMRFSCGNANTYCCSRSPSAGHQYRNTLLLLLLVVSTVAFVVFSLRNYLQATVSGEGSSAGNASCRTFLAEGHTDGNVWVPHGCHMHYYSKQEIAQCMRRSEKATKRRNSFVFIGDSRLREVYHSFMRVATNKPYGVPNEKMYDGSSLTYKDDFFDAEFHFNTHLVPLTMNPAWYKNNTPSFIVVHSGQWNLMSAGGRFQEGLENFKAHMTKLSVQFNELGGVTKVIWMLNSHAMREFFENHDCSGLSYFVRVRLNGCAQQWRRNDWMRAYNDAVIKILSTNSTAYIWTAARKVAHAFAFDMVDGTHLMPQGIDNSLTSPALYLRTQMLLNFHCNRFMDRSTEPFRNTNMCCGGEEQ